MFGGRLPSGTATAETWELSATGWTLRAPATSPPARYGHDLAYDPVRQRVVLFGGFQPALTRLGDTWEWNGTTWAPVATTTAPAARSGHRMAWDPVRQHIVLFGGRITGSSNFYLSDTWTYANGVWSQMSPASSPLPREGGALAWDPGLNGGRIVTLGGLANGGPRSDTWAWDGTTWAPVTTTMAPSARVFFSLEYHPGLNKLVLFGGSTGGSSSATFNAETWVFDRTTWSPLAPLASPSPRNGTVMRWDPLRSKMTLVGGWNSTDTFAEQWEL